MSSFLKYSYLNPIRFFQVGKDDLFTLRKPYINWQTNHYQYFIETDILCFQLLAVQPGMNILYEVCNVNVGELIYWTNIPQLPGGMINEDYYVYQYNAPILGANVAITENIIIEIRVTILAPSGNIILKSEFIEIYLSEYSDQISDNTLAITYADYENKHDFLFTHQNSGVVLLRVIGKISKSDNLQSLTNNVFNITFGNNYGVPNWIVDKLNRVFSLSMVKINGEQYKRKEAVNLESVKCDPGYPKGAWTIELLKLENP